MRQEQVGTSLRLPASCLTASQQLHAIRRSHTDSHPWPKRQTLLNSLNPEGRSNPSRPRHRPLSARRWRNSSSLDSRSVPATNPCQCTLPQQPHDRPPPSLVRLSQLWRTSRQQQHLPPLLSAPQLWRPSSNRNQLHKPPLLPGLQLWRTSSNRHRSHKPPLPPGLQLWHSRRHRQPPQRSTPQWCPYGRWCRHGRRGQARPPLGLLSSPGRGCPDPPAPDGYGTQRRRRWPRPNPCLSWKRAPRRRKTREAPGRRGLQPAASSSRLRTLRRSRAGGGCEPAGGASIDQGHGSQGEPPGGWTRHEGFSRSGFET